jgi:hypothetical protein
MADIAIQIDTTADPAAAYTALTTTDGVAGWWTTRNQTSGTVGEVDQMWFPDAPMAGNRLVSAPQGGARILLDHTGFAQVDEMFRIVTLGWAQMLLQLKQYLDSGRPAPFFSF